MAILGKEAASALAAVEAQQQRLTFQRLVSMVYAQLIMKNSYHQDPLRLTKVHFFLLQFYRLKEKRPSTLE